MTTNKKNLFQNTIVFITSIAVTLLLCNLGAYFWVQNRLKRMQDDNVAAENRYMQPDMQAFRSLYQNRLDHLRGTRDFDEKSEPTDQLFTVIEPFSTRGKNVLLQGDSWANQVTWGDKNGDNPVKLIKRWAEINKTGFIAAGVGSYAPSPMTIQLSILRTDFNLHPTTIVALVDQTDMGDERYRYPDPKQDGTGRVIAIHDQNFSSPNLDASLTIEKNRLIRSDSFALYKLIKYKLLSKQENTAPPPSGDKILEPLRNGVDADLASIFKSRLNKYIDECFADPATQNIILVTHPHRNHLVKTPDGKLYISDVSDLVLDTAQSSRYRNKIKVINMGKHFESVYTGKSIDQVFKYDDPFSHLTDETYLNNFLPFVLSQVQ